MRKSKKMLKVTFGNKNVMTNVSSRLQGIVVFCWLGMQKEMFSVRHDLLFLRRKWLNKSELKLEKTSVVSYRIIFDPTDPIIRKDNRFLHNRAYYNI